MLILITGLPGTGKTTFARALAKRLAATHLNTDIIRIELGKTGQYDPATKEAIYRALRERTRELLLNKQHVVVDATFFHPQVRQPFVEMASLLQVTVKWIEIRAAESVVRQRMKEKRLYSEADFSVYEKIKASYIPLETPHLVLQSDETGIDEMTFIAEKYIKGEEI